MRTISRTSRLQRLSCAALLGAFTFGAVAPSANAGDRVPFHAAFATVAEGTLNFPIISVHVIGVGQTTHLGVTSVETTDQVFNVLTQTGTATYYLTAANGDQVMVEFEYGGPQTPTLFTFTGAWRITGGTGRFGRAAGSGTTEGQVDFTTSPNTGQFTMTGMISSVGSLK